MFEYALYFMLALASYVTIDSRSETLINAGLLTIAVLLVALIHHPFFFLMMRLAMRIRVACMGVVYLKV